VLIERAAGAPLPEVLRERVFEPLGMADTGVWVPAAKRNRFTTFYALLAFTSMLAADGGGLLSAESVRQMTRDRMTAAERAENRVFVGGHGGWGLMMRVPAGQANGHAEPALPGGLGWDGGSGTAWPTDPETGLTGILLTQRMMTSPQPTEVAQDFWAAAYAAAGA
jgi:CubicO group peptidase (beta-lactamase class C family)